MATRELLADLSEKYTVETAIPVNIESIGGVDATRRVNQGEVFDKAIDTLTADGRVATASKVDIAESGVAIAVRANAARPEISNADALRQVVLGASAIGYSTGPSGVALAQLFGQWGIIDELGDRFVQASPGVPVGELLASGDVELGFQQLSELIHIPAMSSVPCPMRFRSSPSSRRVFAPPRPSQRLRRNFWSLWPRLLPRQPYGVMAWNPFRRVPATKAHE